MPVLEKIPLQCLKGLLLITCILLCSAQKQIASEYQIKAVFLFNFAQFVEWPAKSFQETNSIGIGILGDDPFGDFLDETIRGEEVNGHPLVVHRYQHVADVKVCHILFINVVDANQLTQIITSLKSKSILTVSDADSFTKRGGMIRFFTENKKTRLRINLNAAKEAELTISSKLLRLAEVVNQQKN